MDPLRPLAPAIAVAGLLAGSLAAEAWQRAPLPASHARVTALALAPSQPQRLYVGLRGLGVWRSEYRGEIWTDRSADLPADVVVLALEVGPSDPDLVFAGTEANASGPGTVYRSTDGGTSWSVSGTGLDGESVRALEIVPSAPAVVYAGLSGGNQSGVYKSTDAGLTWSHLSGAIPGESAYALAVNPGDPNVIFVGTEDGEARTTDGGATWSTAGTTGGFRSLSWSSANTDRVYASYGGPGLGSPRRSTDQGETFEALFSLPYLATARTVAAHPSDPETAFVGGYQVVGTLGATVQKVWSTTDFGSTYSELFSTARGGDRMTLLVDPFFPNHLYLGEELPGGRGIRHTANGGASWQMRIYGLFNYDIGTLCETATGRIYAYWDARSFFSLGDLTTWFDQGYHGPGIDYAGRVDGLVAGPVGDVLFRWGYWSESDIAGTYFWKSPDGGATWYEGDFVPPGLDGFSPIREVAVDPSTGQTVYVSQESGGLFRNDFGGGDWFQNRTYTLVNPALDYVELAVHPVDPLTLFAAGGPLTVEVSTDGGVTTAPRNSGLPAEGGGLTIEELFLELADPDRLEVVYSDGRVYETRDGGLSWQLRFTLDLQGSAIEGASWDPVSGHVFLATLGAGVVTSHPSVPAGLPTSDVKSVYYSPSQLVLFAGTANAGLWYGTLPPVVSAPELAEKGTPGLSVWPNPFGAATTVELSVPAGGAEVGVTVHDAAGRLVRELSRGWRGAGVGRMAWDGRDGAGRPLPSGVYFVRASVAGEVTSRKVVLRK